eukprot:scaffold242066_cov19-Tisochrysis_lutea.AAC.1
MQQKAERERASKMHDPGLRALFSSVVKALMQGRPITNVPFEKRFLLLNQAPHVPDNHWGVTQGKMQAQYAQAQRLRG